MLKTEEEKKALKEAIELKNAIVQREKIKAVQYADLTLLLISEQGLEFFAKNSAHIEVIRNNTIEKVQFILLPYHKELPKEFKTQFHEKVNRASLKAKISGLIEVTPAAIKVAQHELKYLITRNHTSKIVKQTEAILRKKQVHCYLRQLRQPLERFIFYPGKP